MRGGNQDILGPEPHTEGIKNRTPQEPLELSPLWSQQVHSLYIKCRISSERAAPSPGRKDNVQLGRELQEEDWVILLSDDPFVS